MFTLLLFLLVTLVLPLRGLLRWHARSRPPMAFPRLAVEYVLLLGLLVLAVREARVEPDALGLAVPPGIRDAWWSIVLCGIMIGADHYAFRQAARERRRRALQGLPVGAEAGGIVFSATPWINTACGLLYCLVSAAWEELVFRGGAFHLARLAGLPVIVAIGGGSLLFALNHASGGRSQMRYSFILGCGFAAAYLISGSLWSVIAAHAIGNSYVLLYARPRLAGMQGSVRFQ